MGGPDEAAKKRQKTEDRLGRVIKQLRGGRRSMTQHKRKMSGLLDDLAERRLLSEEADRNMQAQFTGTSQVPVEGKIISVCV